MFSTDHPIQFSPIFRSYLWGGERLARQLGKKPPQNGIWAESWELVDHREAESVVDSGPLHGRTIRELMLSNSKEIIGFDAGQDRFPLLLKYLDCQRVLSVQVHPDDAYGAKMAIPDRGKTEAWYVIDAEPGAKLYAGLKTGVDRQALADAIQAGTTEECLHTLFPKPGDCVFIPAGTVHALGAGLLVAEIQQASDCTFRLFDWNRVDNDGKPRALHIEQSMDVIDFQRGPVDFVARENCPKGIWSASEHWKLLVNCDKFILLENKNAGDTQLPVGRASILTIPVGGASIRWQDQVLHLHTATTVLIPAGCQPTTLHLAPSSTALLSLIPSPQ